MIAHATEYEMAQAEPLAMEDRLRRLQQANPAGGKGFAKAGVRKMIARPHERVGRLQGERGGPIARVELARVRRP